MTKTRVNPVVAAAQELEAAAEHLIEAGAGEIGSVSNHVEAGARGGARTRELIEKGKLYEEMEQRQEAAAPQAPARKIIKPATHHVVEHAPPPIPRHEPRPVKTEPRTAQRHPVARPNGAAK